ncbi:MAG TPA: lytic murein transglycosylase [Rhizomicrobium sp.]|nr:lytic murein transglycosylase [Rhizomicrobium sp.]
MVRAAALVLAGLTAACAGASHAAPGTVSAAPAVPAATAAPASSAALSEDAKFAAFVRDFRAQALAQGILPSTYDRAMGNVHRSARVMELNGNQPEFAKQVWSYLDTAVSDKRVSDGIAAMTANLKALKAAEDKYGVPKEIIVSIWGNESDYGVAQGNFNMFDALTTLAYDGPRTDYARPQLIAALKMMQQEHFKPSEMTCSWAGAFGHTQLIPTEFLLRAVDGDGDGIRDMWHSPADALTSTASIMADYGWKRGERAYIEVKLPANFPYELADGETSHPLSEWKQLGVARVGDMPLPSGLPDHGAIYLPAGVRGPAFMVFDNFRAILKYNNAASYALAIAYLAKRIGGGTPILASWPRDERALTKDERMQFQMNLRLLGYDPGKIDGVLGRGSKAQLRLYQKAHGLPADGFPTVYLLTRMTAEANSRRP